MSSAEPWPGMVTTLQGSLQLEGAQVAVFGKLILYNLRTTPLRSVDGKYMANGAIGRNHI